MAAHLEQAGPQHMFSADAPLVADAAFQPAHAPSGNQRAKRGETEAFGILDDNRATSPSRWRDATHEKTLACPYYKRNSVEHISCLSFKFKRIQDVKQHIRRRHCRISPHHCPTCWEGFTSRHDQEKHVRGRSCHEKPQPPWDGVDPGQMEQLGHRAPSGSSEEFQWQVMWKILWPGKDPPSSVYVGSTVSEVMNMANEYWKQHIHLVTTEQAARKELDWSSELTRQISILFMDIIADLQAKFSDYVSTHRMFDAADSTSSASSASSTASSSPSPYGRAASISPSRHLSRTQSPLKDIFPRPESGGRPTWSNNASSLR